MAGIGIRLNRIFQKRTLTTSLYGVGLSVVYTIAPMLVVMGGLLAMYVLLDFDSVGYYERELFSCSVLYIFIFSLMFSTAFNSTLSKYIADRNFENKLEDIRPCMFLGIILKLGVSTLISVPFYIWEIVVGKVPIYYVFTTYMTYIGLTLVFSVMLYGVVIKQFKTVSLFFIVGSLVTVICSCVFRYLCHFTITYSMLLSLAIGFWLIGTLELFMMKRRFPRSSHRYWPFVKYLRQYWQLIFSDFLYIFGLFCHNFVFWTTDWHLEIARTYICNQPYDMATCLAMFTNLSSTVLFVSKVEMHFFERYSDFNSAVVKGSFSMIKKAKDRMFRCLTKEILDMLYTQFAISVIIFLLVKLLIPYLGFSGLTNDIYPLMAVAYFISFLMYANLLFLQYFNDYAGAVWTGLTFVLVSLVGAIISTRLQPAWYGTGFLLGALASYFISFLRLRSMERNIYRHTFCWGSIMTLRREFAPSAEVYHRDPDAD